MKKEKYPNWKTIQVTEEEYNFLKECKELLNTQDVRSTANPIYCIMDYTEKVPTTFDYTDKYEWVNSDREHIGYNDKDVIEYLLDDEDYYFKVKRYFEDEEDIELEPFTEDTDTKLREDLKDYLDWRYVDNLDDMGIEGINRYPYVEIPKIEQGAPFSFFEIDALEHLESNHYHYSSKAHIYACSSWRSPRMNYLRKILMKLNI